VSSIEAATADRPLPFGVLMAWCPRCRAAPGEPCEGSAQRVDLDGRTRAHAARVDRATALAAGEAEFRRPEMAHLVSMLHLAREGLVDLDAAERLRELEAEFAARGGRDPELADRIDALRREVDGEPEACDECGASEPDGFGPGPHHEPSCSLHEDGPPEAAE
jgi:hypothetical protein